MMKPIYFPFTYIPETIAKPLSQFLGRIIVLQPVLNNQPRALRRLAENGCIDTYVPYVEDEDRLISCLKEFTQWGRLHQGDEASLKDIFKNGFSSQPFTAQIRTDILKDQENDSFDPDPVFLSRLFLLVAQDLDSQQSEVDRELASSIDDEQVLFTSMTGEEKILDPLKKRLFKNDYGTYMIGPRMAAWFQLMKNAVPESAFFVTNSPAVIAEMADHITDLEMIFSVKGVSCDQPEAVINEFAQCLTHLSTTPWSGPDQMSLPDFNCEADQKLNFKLYLLPGVDPVDACNFFSKGKILSKQHERSWLNSLIGFFEI